MYREEESATKQYKQEYIDGIEAFIKNLEKKAESVRDSRNIFENTEKYRKELCAMLGFPLAGHVTESETKVCAEKLSDEDGFSLYRMHFTILDTITVSGLFFKQNGEEKKPLVIVQHGGLGTPELISGVYGDTTNYNDMAQRVLKHGVHIFAPQLLLWSESYNVQFDRQAIDARLKRVGSSITAVEIYAIRKILDYFEQQSYVKNFGMVGLSYGGFYTLFTAAIETRIKAAVSCSFFNARDRFFESDWTWQNSAKKFDDADVACLVYPRNLCIEIGTRDELFDFRYGEKSFEKLKEKCKSVGTDWVTFIEFDGTHEFCHDDAPLENLAKILLNE